MRSTSWRVLIFAIVSVRNLMTVTDGLSVMHKCTKMAVLLLLVDDKPYNSHIKFNYSCSYGRINCVYCPYTRGQCLFYWLPRSKFYETPYKRHKLRCNVAYQKNCIGGRGNYRRSYDKGM